VGRKGSRRSAAPGGFGLHRKGGCTRGGGGGGRGKKKGILVLQKKGKEKGEKGGRENVSDTKLDSLSYEGPGGGGQGMYFSSIGKEVISAHKGKKEKKKREGGGVAGKRTWNLMRPLRKNIKWPSLLVKKKEVSN